MHFAGLANAGLLALASLASANPVPAPDAATSSGTIAKRSFLGSCSNIRISSNPFTLSGSCTRANGAQSSSTLRLDQCITNNNGNLQFKANGNFGGSCSFVEFVSSSEAARLTTRCKTGNGGEAITGIDLNERIVNNNGQLSCFV